MTDELTVSKSLNPLWANPLALEPLRVNPLLAPDEPQPTFTKFPELPKALAKKIVEYLPLGDLPNLAKASQSVKNLGLIDHNHQLWKGRVQKEFPHHYAQLPKKGDSKKEDSQDNSDYKQLYKDFFHKDYRFHWRCPSLTNLFTSAKNGDTDNLGYKLLRISDFYIKDRQDLTLIDWARKNKRQKFLDECFAFITTKHTQNGAILPTVRTGYTTSSILHWAVLCNQPPATLENLLNAGCQIDDRDQGGESALYLAAKTGNLPLTTFLLEHGANIETGRYFSTPLLTAVQHQHVAVVEYLADKQANIQSTNSSGQTALHIAAKVGNTEILRILLQHKAAINASNNTYRMDPLGLAAESGHLEIVKILIAELGSISPQDPRLSSALLHAAKYGRLDVVQHLIALGVDPNVHAACSALYWAAHGGYSAVVEFLANRGANVKFVSPVERWTPLHAAALHCNGPAITALISHGADVNAVTAHTDTYAYADDYRGDGSYTPLHLAAVTGNHEAVIALLKHNADLDMETSLNKNPLKLARLRDKNPVLKALYTAKLERYIATLTDRIEKGQLYKTSLTFFGYTLHDFGYSAIKKKEAALSLQSVLENKKAQAELEQYKGELNNGELGTIYHGLS